MKKGFTLVELVIVIIIVGILSIVAVPIYKGYTDRAKESEGKALLGSINTAEKVYFAEHNEFVGVNASGAYGNGNALASSTNTCSVLSVDARANKYYKKFGVSVTNTGSDPDARSFTAYVFADQNASGSSNLQPITLQAGATGQPTISGGVSGNSNI